MLEVNGLFVDINGQPILKGVDFSVKGGELMGLLGPSGCGKSTLLKAVAGILPPKSGSILIGGEDMANVPPHKRGAVIVFQDMRLFPNMTALEKIKDFIGQYPGADIFRDFHVDYTDQIPFNGGVFPSGLVEVSRTRDILGNTTVVNQYNFGLYYVFEKSPGDDTGASENAGWVMDFQEWVQKMSVMGNAPTFGDDPRAEKITAQNGVLYGADEEGTAMYMVQLSVQFKKRFMR